jgi:hypothetical protein
MSKSKLPRRDAKKQERRTDKGAPEDVPVEAMMVAWTASVMSVLMADLATVAAHFYTRFHADSKTAPPFEAIMLLTACFLGVASLALLAIVWRKSRMKPPRGFVVFAICVAVAPIVATVARLVNS